MTFKANWEKLSQQVILSKEIIHNMLAQAYPDKCVYTQHMLDGGCANINMRVQFEQDNKPVLLRVYLRDTQAAYREQSIAALIHQVVPVPHLLHVGTVNDYQFAIAEWLPGITLRELLLGDQTCDIAGIMHQMGRLLAKFTPLSIFSSRFFP